MTINEMIEKLKVYDGDKEITINGRAVEYIFTNKTRNFNTINITTRGTIPQENPDGKITLRSLLDRTFSPLQIYTGVTPLDTDVKWENPDLILSRASATSLSVKLLDEDIASIEAHHDTLLVKIINSYH